MRHFLTGLLVTVLVLLSMAVGAQSPPATQIVDPGSPAAAVQIPPTLPSPTFRNTTWGMSIAQVKATEKKPPKAERAYQEGSPRLLLVYEDKIAGLDCDVVYLFAYGKLVRAKYLVDVEHSNRTDWLRDFATLRDILGKKYGAPTKEDTFWKRDLYRDDPSNWGMAVAVGHLSRFAIWETPGTTISEAIYGENYDITLNVEYAGQEFRQLEEQARTAEDQGKL